jgi:hypothetical protein
MRITCTEQSHPPLVVTTFAEYDGGLCAMPEWAEAGSVCAISGSERGSRCAVSGESSCALLGAGSWVEIPVNQKAHDRRGRLRRLYPATGTATNYLTDYSLVNRVPGTDRDRHDRIERPVTDEQIAAGEQVQISTEPAEPTPWPLMIRPGRRQSQRADTRISYSMECRRCGLRAEARADTLNNVLSRIAKAGGEELSLRGLVSILANYSGRM